MQTMRFFPRFLSTSFVLFLVFAGTANAQKYKLAFSPETGTKATWEITMDMDMNMKPAGVDMEMNMEMDFGIGMTLEVEEGPDADGLVKVNTTLDSMRMGLSGMPGMAIDYNSADADGDPMSGEIGKTLEPLFTADIKQTLNAQGQVVATSGLEELLEEMGGGSGISGMSSNPYENFQSYMAAFPKKKVKVGDSWEQEVTLTNNGVPTSYTNTYTLMGVDQGIASIKVESMISMEEAEIEQNGMAMTMTMRGTQSGTMLVRMSDGMTMNMVMEQSLSMDMMTMGMEMPANIKSDILLKPIQR